MLMLTPGECGRLLRLLTKEDENLKARIESKLALKRKNCEKCP